MGLDVKEIAGKILNKDGIKEVILAEILDGVVKAKLDALVADSSNSFDDMLLGMLYPEIRKAAEGGLDDLLAKIFPAAPAA